MLDYMLPNLFYKRRQMLKILSHLTKLFQTLMRRKERNETELMIY